jgi:hypothetical protein
LDCSFLPRCARRWRGAGAASSRSDPARHAAGLFAANQHDAEGRNWTYLPYGPFDTLAAYLAWLEPASRGSDPLSSSP